MLQLAKSCICIEKPLYFYRCREGSVSAYYYEDRYKCHDTIFAEGIKLLKIWNRNTEENFLNLCLRHFEGMRKELQMVVDAEKMSIKEKLRIIEKILKDEIYTEYIGVFCDEIKKDWEDVRYNCLGKIYNSCIEKGDKDRWNFFCYNFGREFIARKAISEGTNNEYDIMLYMAAASSPNNVAIYQNELLQLCVKCITGKECTSLSEVKQIVQEYTCTGEMEYDKKLEISELLEKKDFIGVEKLLETFSEKMVLDCDVLFARACCCYERKEIRSALVLLAVANELYPKEIVISEYIYNIVQDL